MTTSDSFPSLQVSTVSAPMLCSLFVKASAISRHLNAPMLAEREAYVRHLLSLGRTRKTVREAAVAISHAQRLLDWSASQSISEDELRRAAAARLEEMRLDSRLPIAVSSDQFLCTMRSWVRFLALYAEHESAFGPLKPQFRMFLAAMLGEYGYLPTSVAAFQYALGPFLIWTGLRRQLLSEITLIDIDLYISERRFAGWKSRTVQGFCRALRRFFKYAELQGWSSRNLSTTVKAPVHRCEAKPPDGPTWKQVRRCIAALDDSAPSQCRAKAVLLLASVYGLRTCEIARMELDDLDWFNEVLTIRRAKRGRIQQFPLNYEVGNAIIRYIQRVRPTCNCRNLFISRSTPHRPMENLGPPMRRFLNNPRIFKPACGLHALRHACATELLHQGTSLRAIADFLGHRGLRSVSIYAHSDVRALNKVSDFDLKGVL